MDRKMTSPISARGITPQTSVQLKELLDASPDIISLIDTEEWCVKYQNAAGDGVLGNIVGKHCYESIAKLPNNCPFCKAPEALATGKTTKAELPLPDGKWLLIQYAPVRKGEKLLVAETITDITEQKHLQEEYRKIKDELADLNRSLEERIEQQVAELEKLGKLKRFLSPPVAELILSGAAGDPFKTRRGKVTILFLDLRGFTSFAEMGEPEEVMEVLQNYHSQLGRLIQEYQGTIERFTGDGMMLIFNDPIVTPNPEEQAVRLAVAIRDTFKKLQAEWAKCGYSLGLGIGIADGYATIGTIGFEGRLDYTVIGTVTNLAARLCAEAKPDQILVSHRVLSCIDTIIEAEPAGELQLKGLHNPVRAYNVIRLK